MVNEDIRTAAKDAGVMLWQIADGLGCTDSTFSRMMRHELPEEKKQEILSIIDQLRKEE